jgi:hypothetical protein
MKNQAGAYMNRAGISTMGIRWSEDDLKDYFQKRGVNPEPKKKKSKYNNSRVRVDGLLFDSQKEADTYQNLKVLHKAGLIKGFCRQAEFVLQEGFANVKPIIYRCDWIVFLNDGSYEIRDDKGIKTEVFKLKHKMFMERFPRLQLKVMK